MCITGVDIKRKKECEVNVEVCEMCQMEEGKNKQQSSKCIIM